MNIDYEMAGTSQKIASFFFSSVYLSSLGPGISEADVNPKQLGTRREDLEKQVSSKYALTFAKKDQLM